MRDTISDMRYAVGNTQYAIRNTPTSAWATLLILAAVVLALAPALIRPDGLIYPDAGLFSDLTITHWPAFEYLRDSMRSAGAFPLWRSTILGGTPFAADPVSGLWYPPNWLSLVLPLEWFFKLIVTVHLFVGGWSMMWLARSFGAGWIGAAASGVAYAIAPRVLAHTGAGHVLLVEAWTWIPFAAWGVRQNGSAAWAGAAVSGAALGLCALADLRVAVYAGTAVVLYMLVAPRVEAVSLPSRLIRLIVILLVAAWLSAATWLPAQSLAAESTRVNLSLDEAGAFSLPPGYLLGMLLADRGDVERVTYVGLAVLVMALIGVRSAWRDRRRVAIWLIALTALGALAALGANTPLYALLYRLPGVSLLRVPARAWILVTFAAALACGLGIDALVQWPAGRPIVRRWRLASVLAGSFALLFGAGGALIVFAGGQAGAARVGQSMIGLAIFLPLSIGLAAARARGRLAPARFGLAVLAVIAVDLAWVGWGHYRVISRDEAFADGRAVAEYLVSVSGGPASGESASVPSATLRGSSRDASYRVYSPSYSLPQHVAQAHGLEQVDGIDPLQLERTVRFMQRATGVGAWGYSVTLPAFEGLGRDEELRTLLSGVVPDPALLGVLSVKYVVAHFPIAHPDLIERARIGGVFVYENTRARPRAWIVRRVDEANTQAEAIAWLSARDLSSEAVVEGGAALRLEIDSSEARIMMREPDRVLVSARGPGLLVLSEVAERDWRASIDGAPTPIYPTNGVLRGVYLPEGQHQIEFIYDPIVVKAAVAASGIGWIGLAGWRVGSLVRARKRRET